MARVETIVFLSLVLDLFAFTIPLPLFPRIIEWYRVKEISHATGFLSRTLQFVSFLRGLFYQPAVHSSRWDVVLLGGLMGSTFSMLQFFVSPHIGGLSDKYGRKNILLLTLSGNIMSALVWIQSTTFASYMLSRVIGGLSEGNVQLANAIISDVTLPARRSKALSSVGIAFAICFCVGPPIGAYFASTPLPSSLNAWGLELNLYATPAILTLILLVVETIYLAYALPETRGMKPPTERHRTGSRDESANGNGSSSTTSKGQWPNAQSRESVEERIHRLKSARRFHLLFMCVFSGVEFTLTFLTFDLFDWSNKQNGALIGGIGVANGLLQRGYVRSAMSKVGEIRMARRGILSCALGFTLLALVPQFASTHHAIAIRLLQGAALFLAMTSATVVTSLTAYTSLQCHQDFDTDTGKAIEQHPQLAIGKALGQFRSSGQGGRGIGPLIACASYWTFGPSTTYAAGAVAMFALIIYMKSLPSSKLST